MDPFLARTMVESLSKGIDPLSGRVLPLDDSCSNEEVQDALLTVLEHCSIESNEEYLHRLKEEKKAEKRARRETSAKRYPRGGEPWRRDEEKQLINLHHEGATVYTIAAILKRTPQAIEGRLKKMNIQPRYR